MYVCAIGVWLVVLASSSILFGKVPRLMVKKTNRLTQAVVFFRRHFLCGALCKRSSAEREGLSTYLQRECAAEPFMRRILSRRIFTSLPGSRLRIFITMQIQYLLAQLCTAELIGSMRRTLVFEIVHDESVKVYPYMNSGMFSRTLCA